MVHYYIQFLDTIMDEEFNTKVDKEDIKYYKAYLNYFKVVELEHLKIQKTMVVDLQSIIITQKWQMARSLINKRLEFNLNKSLKGKKKLLSNNSWYLKNYLFNLK